MKLIDPTRLNLNVVELHLTYRCNLKCNNCGTQCTQAPSDFIMPLNEIFRFMAETLETEYPWHQITLTGGEPTLYPDLIEVCKMLRMLDCTIAMATNMTNPSLVERIRDLGVMILSAPKKEKSKDTDGRDLPYVPVNEAPFEVEPDTPHLLGCGVSAQCGLAFNGGFFPCTPGAAAARVFNYEPPARHISEITNSKMAEFFLLHCGLCGHSLPGRRRVIEQSNSPTWSKALDCYTKGNRYEHSPAVLHVLGIGSSPSLRPVSDPGDIALSSPGVRDISV